MNKKHDDIENLRLKKFKDPEINLYILLIQAFDIVSNAVDLELKQHRMTQPQVKVLTMLSRENKPVTLDELSNWCLKAFNSVSTLTNRMEAKGLVKKVKNNRDLKTYVMLTEKGSIAYHKTVTERSIHLIFSKLTNEERKQFKTILEKVRDVTREMLGIDFKPPFLL